MSPFSELSLGAIFLVEQPLANIFRNFVGGTLYTWERMVSFALRSP